MKIEKNVPIIKILEYRARENKSETPTTYKYPWKEMGVGDSFYIEGYTTKMQRQLSTLGKAYAANNNPSAKFITRKDGTGLRIYRIS